MDKFKRILQFCGACIAFYIGAGFATMQEVMQYEASYGSEFWVVIAVCAVIYVYTNLSFISNGHRLHVKHNGDIYKAYCGKYIRVYGLHAPADYRSCNGQRRKEAECKIFYKSGALLYHRRSCPHGALYGGSVF